MKLSIFAFLATAAPALATIRGFNSPATLSNGACKTTSDWLTSFRGISSSPGGFKTVRLYASSDCNALANAVPAALQTKTKIVVGIWTEDSDHYNAEKQALLSAIAQYGHGWIQAISVGSEDLYRGDSTAVEIAIQVYDVRGMVRAQGVNVPVGHVDTWTSWTNPGNNAVITASDFIGMDAYPYFQAAPIQDAVGIFMQNLTNTEAYVHSVKRGVPLWITETGWPVSGETYGGVAVASVDNARTYWEGLMCSGLLSRYNVLWYVDSDWWMTPSFGMIGKNGKRRYNIAKC